MTKTALDLVARRVLEVLVGCVAALVLDPSVALAAQPLQPVRPVLQCVGRRGGDELIAYFGYTNGNASAVSVPHGPDNRVHPDGDDGRQPSSFLPGRVTDAFSVPLTNEEVVWTVRGPDGVTNVAIASPRSRPCATHSGLAEGGFAPLTLLLTAATAMLWWVRSRRTANDHVR
jgi:hypothetical protein